MIYWRISGLKWSIFWIISLLTGKKLKIQYKQRFNRRQVFLKIGFLAIISSTYTDSTHFRLDLLWLERDNVELKYCLTGELRLKRLLVNDLYNPFRI